MATTNEVNYKRDTLVDRLKETLTQRETERQESKDRVDAINKKSLDAIVAALTEHPELLVAAAGYFEDWVGVRPSDEKFAEQVSELYKPTPSVRTGKPVDPDEDLKHLIRVYENASDDTITVSVHDSLYCYL